MFDIIIKTNVVYMILLYLIALENLQSTDDIVIFANEINEINILQIP